MVGPSDGDRSSRRGRFRAEVWGALLFIAIRLCPLGKEGAAEAQGPPPPPSAPPLARLTAAAARARLQQQQQQQGAGAKEGGDEEEDGRGWAAANAFRWLRLALLLLRRLGGLTAWQAPPVAPSADAISPLAQYVR